MHWLSIALEMLALERRRLQRLLLLKSLTLLVRQHTFLSITLKAAVG